MSELRYQGAPPALADFGGSGSLRGDLICDETTGIVYIANRGAVIPVSGLPVVSLATYGKSGGIFDNTSAYTQAATAAIAQGRPLFIPAGVWRGSLNVTSAMAGLTVIGEDWHNTILDSADNSNPAIGVQVAAHFVTLVNFRVINTRGNNGTHYGIWSKGDGAGHGASRLRMMNLKVDGYNINARLDQYNDHEMIGVWLSNAVAAAAAESGANLYAGHPTLHSVGLTMANVHAQLGKFGYYLQTAEGLNMAQCDTASPTANAFIHLISGGGITGMEISDCYFDGSGADAVYLQGVNHANIECWASASIGGIGVVLDNSNFNALKVQAVNCISHGVQLKSGCNSNEIDGEYKGNGGDGVRIETGSVGNIVGGIGVSNASGVDFRFLDVTAGVPNILDRFWANSSYVLQAKDVVGAGYPGRPWIQFALSDASGAGLSLAAGTDAWYEKVGRTVRVRARVIYPATASGLTSKIGGLPYPVINSEAARQGNLSYTNSAVANGVMVTPNASTFEFWINGSAQATNAQMTGTQSYCCFEYETSSP